MSPLGIAALSVYGVGFVIAFFVAAGEIARDEACREPRKTDPAWLNGGAAFGAALFWPLIAVLWSLGRAYTHAARVGR